MNDLDRYNHCSYCACKFDLKTKEATTKICNNCKNITYDNPIPVVIAMIPLITDIPLDDIKSSFAKSMLVIKRGIEPHIGRWALPGGFMEKHETWEEAAKRELFEETGIVTNSNDFKLHSVKTAANGNLLIFGLNRSSFSLKESRVVFKPNREVTEIGGVIEGYNNTMANWNLAFPTHTEAVLEYFKR